jgi:hypothetical protein
MGMRGEPIESPGEATEDRCKGRPTRGIESVLGRGRERSDAMTTVAMHDAPRLTRHSTERQRQRGYLKEDLGLVLEVGTPAGNAVLLTDRDVNERVAECRRRISQLERLRGTAVILDGDTILSVYRARRHKARRLLRHRQGRGLGVPRPRVPRGWHELDEACCA